jgi:drug/metabolite transporter (DMT)-like permease
VKKSSSGSFRAELTALLVVTIWGVNFVFQKAVLAEFNPMAFTFLRFIGMIILAWLVLLIIKLRAKPQTQPRPKSPFRQDLPRLLLASFLGFSLYMPLWVISLNYTTAFSGALLAGTVPLFATLLLYLLKLEQFRGWQWGALAVALVGLIVFMADKFSAGVQLGTLGDLIGLVSAFCYAAYLVANKPLIGRYSAPQLTAYTLTIGGIPVLLAGLPFMFSQDWTKITATGWLTLAYAIVVPVYIAWSLWSWVNGRLGVARTSVFMYLVPLIGGVTSAVLLGEAFGILKILGAGLILFGIVLARKSALPTVKRPEIPQALQSTPIK